MKNLFLSLAALILCAAASAQKTRDEMTLTAECGPNGEYIIKADVHVPGIYSVLVNFSNVTNYRVGSYEVRPVYGSGEVLRIKPENPDAPADLDGEYTYIWGLAGRDRPDTSFVYALPYSTHRKGIRCGYAREIMEFLKNERTEGFVSLAFDMQRGDTVRAARKGTVVYVVNEFPRQIIYPVAQVNYLIVQHPDNTFATYSRMEYGGMLVEKGDVVYPGMPLGLIGSKDEVEYTLHFTIDNLRVDHSGAKASFKRDFYNPAFATAEGDTRLAANKAYQAVANPSLVTKEMNAREKKKYLAEGYPRTVGSKNVAAVAAAAASAVAAAPPTPAQPAQAAQPTPPAAPTADTPPTPSPRPAAAAASASTSPPRPVKVFSFLDPGGVFVLFAEVATREIVHSVTVSFRDVDNYPMPQYLLDTVTVSRRLLSVAPTDPGKRYWANFSSVYRPGNAVSPPDTNYVYRLPFRPETRNVKSGAYRSATSPSIALRFGMHPGDTVYAIREGRVTGILKSSSNGTYGINVQHADGSEVVYPAGSSRESIPFNEGDAVASGAPVTTVTAGSGSLTLYLRYVSVTEQDPGKFESRYFSPVFQTPKGKARLPEVMPVQK